MSYAGATGRLGWQTALDFSWTAQGTDTIGSDGNTAIGGVTWKKSNSANEASAMAYSASGLVIAPAQTSDYGTTRTLPLLWTSLSTLIPTLELSFGIRAWAYWSAETGVDGNYKAMNLAIDNDSTTGFACARGYHAGGAQGFADWINNAGVNSLNFQNTSVSLADSNRVVMLEIPHLGYGAYKMYYGAWASGWPAASTLTGPPGGILSRMTALTVANAGVMIGAQRSGNGTAATATLSRLRIDYIVR